MDLLEKMYQYTSEKHPISQPPLTTLESSLKRLFPLGCLTFLTYILPKVPLNEFLNTVILFPLK